MKIYLSVDHYPINQTSFYDPFEKLPETGPITGKYRDFEQICNIILMKVKHETHCWVMDDSYHKVLDSCTLAKKENSIGWLQQNEIFDKENLWWFMPVS